MSKENRKNTFKVGDKVKARKGEMREYGLDYAVDYVGKVVALVTTRILRIELRNGSQAEWHYQYWKHA